MVSKKEIHLILTEAVLQEKRAEDHCQEILEFAELNGFTEIVVKIRNDEKHHQVIVKELINFLNYKPGIAEPFLKKIAGLFGVNY